MYQSLSKVTASPPKHVLPKELEIIIDNASCCPTHMLAVRSSSPQNNQMHRVIMYPTHHLILAAHCANLPALSSSCTLPDTSSSSSSTTATIPVVSLSLPSPPTFPLLHSYLYTKDAESLVSALFSSSNEPDALKRQVALVYGVWANAYALGVVDENLFDVLHRAWALVVAKLETVSS